MKKVITIIILIFVLLVSGTLAYLILTEKMIVQSPVLFRVIPKINFVFGDVSYRDRREGKWRTAIVGKELPLGFELKTGKNSFADIGFHKGMSVRVSGNSNFRIDQITVRKMILSMEFGSIYGMFEKLFEKHSIVVKTPTVVMAVRGTDLGIEVGKAVKEEKEAKLKKDEKGRQPEETEEEMKIVSTVYSLSGITEIYNPVFENQKVLLAYESKVKIEQDNPPGNPEKLTQEEILGIRSVLNAIHTEEVLFISDKIHFKLGSAEILPSSYPELDKIAEVIKDKNAKIRIEGHTDDIGEASYNQDLSVKRAAAIRDYFVKRGIEPENLMIEGYGESKPLVSNKTEEGRASNRRVEFIVIE